MKKQTKAKHWYSIKILAACMTICLGLGLCLRPGLHLMRRSVLQYQAKTLWQKTKRLGVPPKVNLPVAWIKAPSANLDTMVLLGASEKNLHQFPAWDTRSAKPGAQGRAIVFGHRDAHFKRLGSLTKGDTVAIEGVGWQEQYAVDQIEVISRESLGQRLTVDPSRGHQVVMVTCYPFRFAGSAPQRYLVWLTPKESPEGERPTIAALH